ncbi:hypothetical protein PIB30_046051 [Stylosanthes scabra]|uniref:Terpene synthase metal-binding domain-containing protein n=1 Tax=Stylosanthes scabra TaxID=79078 RepID=A0ABU6RGN2_9FABA|nr:hypothetical protein [Stylosanthes scabra]
MTVVDDTYDVYGTIEELELFTQAIQRWDIGCIASLPECYKAIFNAHVELFDEMIELLNAVDGELDLVLQYLKKAFEQQRKHGASAVECCMNQYGFSQEEAYEFIKKDINNSWKDMNEEYLKLVEHIPSPILDCIINLARICEFLYANFEDKVTNCALFKDQIEALLLDPVVV